jgi:hypothetical protein
LNLKAKFETRNSHSRFKGQNQTLSSYGSNELNVHSPTVELAQALHARGLGVAHERARRRGTLPPAKAVRGYLRFYLRLAFT